MIPHTHFLCSIFIRFNLTNVDEPLFVIDSLDAYTSFEDDALKAVIFSVNQKGRSHGVLIKEFILDSSIESRAGTIQATLTLTHTHPLI
jgi:hypothetical protein